MSFWMPFLSEMKKDKKINEEVEMRDKTKEEIKIKEIENRLAAIERISICDGKTIKEYNSLKNKLKELKKEKNYTNWFRKNEREIEKFFKELFNEFTSENNSTKVFTILYKKNNILKYRRYEFNYDFMRELLIRYGYIIEEGVDSDDRTVIKIGYERRF